MAQTEPNIEKIIDFYKRNLFTKTSIENLYKKKKLTKKELDRILESKEV